MNVLKYPFSTEKVIRLMEKENKLLFIVDIHAKKKDVKKAIEDTFKVKVEKVNSFIIKGQKRVYVKFGADTPAIDIATQLGMI